jgi:toxin ParE1/3/4
MRILWSPLALDRVAEITEYIAADNPGAAENWVNAVFEKVKELKKFPEIGRVIPEVDNKSIRELIYGNYRIVYRVEETRLSVLTVRHGKQILPVDEIKA